VASADCAAPLPPSTGAATSSTSTTQPMGLSPPFPGATVVGLIAGLLVENVPAIDCLENANQSSQLGVPSAVTTTPELVVWQWPGNLQYDYVVATTTPSGPVAADCANATLAFPIP
jgi:hypothetical protein